MPESSLNLRHRVSTVLTSASGATGLRAEDKAGDQVIRNDLIGAHTGAPERASVNELSDGLVEFEFACCRAVRGRPPPRRGSGLRPSVHSTGRCCGQFASQADTLNRITCSGRAL